MPEEKFEVLPPSATFAIERAAIDSQIATAHAYPRSLAVFKKRAAEMATLDLETAESCIYSRPVGGGKTATGESIRMAEIVAACYGNLRVAARIVEQTERWVKVEGVAHDLESNYAGKSEVVEPTVMKDGKPYSESQRAVVAKAALSKAYRDAVFKVVPKALCKSVTEAAKLVINKEVATMEQRISRVRKWLQGIKVDDKRVFAVLGENVKGWPDVTDEHLTTLTGLKTAINDDGVPLEEAFPNAPAAPKINHSAAGKDELFPDGKKPVEKPVEILKSKLSTEVTEAAVLAFMREKKLIDDSLSSLAEVAEISPGAIEAVLKTWADVERKIKPVATKPATTTK